MDSKNSESFGVFPVEQGRIKAVLLNQCNHGEISDNLNHYVLRKLPVVGMAVVSQKDSYSKKDFFVTATPITAQDFSLVDVPSGFADEPDGELLGYEIADDPYTDWEGLAKHEGKEVMTCEAFEATLKASTS